MGHPPAKLLKRLDAVAASVARRSYALALIGLGSVGAERERLDAFSDLDFFVIVEPGHEASLLDSLSWLEQAAHIGFSFRNTPAGYKVMFADGVYAEFAVFTPDELASIPATAAAWIWRRKTKAAQELQLPRLAAPGTVDRAFLVGEILTNLYVGLTRLRRGELVSAHRFIQGYAVGSLLKLWPELEPESRTPGDPFDETRRFETRFPGSGPQLADFLQGYDRSVESALAILKFLELRFPVDREMKRRILQVATSVPGRQIWRQSRASPERVPILRWSTRRTLPYEGKMPGDIVRPSFG
ncbi:MAG TPA: hypothetical protein VG815_04230 [Chloroflexota bacterium]|jgi:hypothetical protein|nr:hypothetical protein [Chloroflexota bacterium]